MHILLRNVNLQVCLNPVVVFHVFLKKVVILTQFVIPKRDLLHHKRIRSLVESVTQLNL